MTKMSSSTQVTQKTIPNLNLTTVLMKTKSIWPLFSPL